MDDYVRQLETQNEELKQLLANAQEYILWTEERNKQRPLFLYGVNIECTFTKKEQKKYNDTLTLLGATWSPDVFDSGKSYCYIRRTINRDTAKVILHNAKSSKDFKNFYNTSLGGIFRLSCIKNIFAANITIYISTVLLSTSPHIYFHIQDEKGKLDVSMRKA